MSHGMAIDLCKLTATVACEGAALRLSDGRVTVTLACGSAGSGTAAQSGATRLAGAALLLIERLSPSDTPRSAM